jgi:hypothetical protein
MTLLPFHCRLSKRFGGEVKDRAALIVAILAFVATSINAGVAYKSFKLNNETQHAALHASLANQRAVLFSNFQQQYSTIAAGFPPGVYDPTFRPKPRSEEYAKLWRYWLFCFSEWYVTNRLDREAYKSLWDSYYSPLVTSALRIPSLRYVLESMILSQDLHRGEYRGFFQTLSKLARESDQPLSPAAEKKLAAAGQPHFP